MGIRVLDILNHLGFAGRDGDQLIGRDEVKNWQGKIIYSEQDEYDTNRPIFISGNGYKVAGAMFERTNPYAKLPHKNNALDAGYDVCSVEDAVTIYPGKQRVVDTGLRLSFLNDDLGIFVWPKGGLDAMYGLHTGAGVIDAGYRGPIKIVLKNQGVETITIRPGDEIAQLVFMPIAHPIIGFSGPTPSERGESGGVNET